MTSSPLSLISIAFLDKLGRLEDKKCWNSKLWNQLNDLSAKLGPSASWSNRYFCWTPARRRVESHQKIIWSRTRNPLKARSPLCCRPRKKLNYWDIKLHLENTENTENTIKIKYSYSVTFSPPSRYNLFLLELGQNFLLNNFENYQRSKKNIFLFLSWL